MRSVLLIRGFIKNNRYQFDMCINWFSAATCLQILLDNRLASINAELLNLNVLFFRPLNFNNVVITIWTL